MKDPPLSICEKEFILAAINQEKRLDERGFTVHRKVRITFGIDRGCCHVELGKTRVMVQVSCEINAPKQSRLNEGTMFINVEVSPMAAPSFETRKQDLQTEITRLLERSIKNSRCVDLESLCILQGEKVWDIRVDVHVLNHEGNILDCANIAAIAALAHFRRPEVTVSGQEITVHPVEERDPVPLSVLHMPICVTFAFFHNGKNVLVDPSDSEERVMDGKLVVSMNKHREICTQQMSGQMLLDKDKILGCTNMAVTKVAAITDLIQEALENDAKARDAGEKYGYAEAFDRTKITANEHDRAEIDVSDIDEQVAMMMENGDADGSSDEDDDNDIQEIGEQMETKVTIMGKGTGMIGDGGVNTWQIDDDMEEEIKDGSTSVRHQHDENTLRHQQKTDIQDTGGELSGDSEEETTVTLGDTEFTKATKASIKQSGDIDLTAALKTKQKKKKKTKTKMK